jgi:hypothetical protein
LGLTKANIQFEPGYNKNTNIHSKNTHETNEDYRFNKAINTSINSAPKNISDSNNEYNENLKNNQIDMINDIICTSHEHIPENINTAIAGVIGDSTVNNDDDYFDIYLFDSQVQEILSDLSPEDLDELL